ncbi:hypothetical protein QJQ45_004207 [Haematococcus lacustris]|nr:hypothetical protein QJQ45_004207 [Haematococcus lacustris]
MAQPRVMGLWKMSERRHLQRNTADNNASILTRVPLLPAQLQEVDAGPGYVTRLAASIDAVDSLLAQFKAWQAQSVGSLANQASQLEEEVEAAVAKVEEEVEEGQRPGSSSNMGAAEAAMVAGARGAKEAWGPGSASGARQPCNLGRVAALAAAGQGSLAPEVLAFEQFEELHGATGGWEAEDHTEFVNILKACAGDYTQAITLTLERCVGYSKAEVVQHARWHMDYMDLLVRKRMAVARWRAQRDQQRAKLQARAAIFEPESAVAAQAEHSAEAAQQGAAARELALKKELVLTWKERRAAAVREATAAAAARARQEQERRETEFTERQHINKLKLEYHQQYKEHLDAEQRRRSADAAQQRKALAALTPQQVLAVAQRSSETLARRQQLLASKHAAARQRSSVQDKLLEKVHVSAPSDPSRLLRATAAHLRRQEERREEERRPRDSSFILHVNHLAAPGWRAGLT